MRIVLAVLLFPSTLSAQAVVALPAASEGLDDEFTRITAIRELADSRVLIADAREKRLVVGDWATRQTRQLGRHGDGPHEYRAPSRLLAAGGDSTFIIDTQARRWILLHRDRFGPSLGPEHALRLTRFEPPLRGMDDRGRILVTMPLASRPGIQRAFDSDSLLLAIADLGSPGVDTIARLRGRGSMRGAVTRNDGGRPTVYALYNPMGVEEQAWLFADGWIAIALLEPYRVDWLKPDGSMIRGPALDIERRSVTDDEKRFAIARDWSWLPKPLPSPSDFRAWPEHVPAFENDALLGMSDGRLAIKRMSTIAAPASVYDVVDRSGTVSARIGLQPNQRILGFGRAHVFVVTKGEFDVERVSRHPLPTFLFAP